LKENRPLGNKSDNRERNRLFGAKPPKNFQISRKFASRNESSNKGGFGLLGRSPRKISKLQEIWSSGNKTDIRERNRLFCAKPPKKFSNFKKIFCIQERNLTTKEDSDFWGEAPENFQNCKKFGHKGTNLTIEKGTDSIAVQTPKNVQISRKSTSRDESDNKRRFRLLGAKPPKIF
jgi:hypothetical protein